MHLRLSKFDISSKHSRTEALKKTLPPMFLSINPLLPEISCIVIDGDAIIEQSTLTKNLETASTFPRHIIDIMNRHTIDEIWCVTGPGPFTMMRIVTLTCNAIGLAR
jgi:tRNA A37 threonylcarbamoyladenosine modification protein TsaB